MEYLHFWEESSPKHPPLLLTPLPRSAPAPTDANHLPCAMYTRALASRAGGYDSFLWSWSGRKATQSWVSSVALLFWTPVCYSQWICSFLARVGGRGPPTSLPTPNGTRSEHHQPLMPQQATGEKGKTKVTTKAVAMNTSFPTEEPLRPWAIPEITLPLSPPSPPTKQN